MSKLIAASKIENCHTVTLREHDHGKMGKTYTVRYGKQSQHLCNLTLAQEEYQFCVLHQYACAGYNR